MVNPEDMLRIIDINNANICSFRCTIFKTFFKLNDTQINTITDRLSTILGLTPLALGFMSTLIKTWHHCKYNRL